MKLDKTPFLKLENISEKQLTGTHKKRRKKWDTANVYKLRHWIKDGSNFD